MKETDEGKSQDELMSEWPNWTRRQAFLFLLWLAVGIELLFLKQARAGYDLVFGTVLIFATIILGSITIFSLPDKKE